MKRKINETLAELMTGIFVAGVVIQVVELLIAIVSPEFAGSVLSFVIGFWIGIVTALGLAAHMNRSIDRALDMLPGDAEKYMRKAYLLRTMAILVVAGLVHFLHLGYVMATFLGILCLKFGAFLQPLMHKLWKKFQK
ncbi:MAG: hypothetical protein Q4C61_16960 [Lachnospiraceae bacterium]|nr:hypothetical protein [Lachnospiraceae bacterium]